MADKSPRSHMSKGATKSIKEKRAEKKAKSGSQVNDAEIVAKVRKR